MGIKKFIKRAKEILGLEDEKKESKKKSLKRLLKKLIKRKREICTMLKDKKSKELQEELDIVSLQIKKGKKILHELYKSN